MGYPILPLKIIFLYFLVIFVVFLYQTYNRKLKRGKQFVGQTPLLLGLCQEVCYMAKKEGKIKKISVRLDEDACMKLDKAKAKGFNTSQYINKIIKDSSARDTDIGSMRSILISVNRLHSYLEFEEDPEMKKNMREELNQICRVLKSIQNHT